MTAERKKAGRLQSITVGSVRARLAQLLGLACAVCAGALAVAALIVALGTSIDDDNGLVSLIMDAAELVDLGVFSIDDGVLDFVGKNSDIKNALANYGLGAVFWLVLGRVLDRVVRP